MPADDSSMPTLTQSSLPTLSPDDDGPDDCSMPDDDGVSDDSDMPQRLCRSFATKCCNKNCLLRSDLHEMAAANKRDIHRGTHAEGDAQLMGILATTCEVSSNSVRWKVGDEIVCRTAWRKLHGLGASRVQKVLRSFRTSRLPPQDGRHWNQPSGRWVDPP